MIKFMADTEFADRRRRKSDAELGSDAQLSVDGIVLQKETELRYLEINER